MNDLINRKEAIKALKEDADWLSSQGSDWQTERLERDVNILQELPSAQSEVTEKDVKEYCQKRCLVVIDSFLFHRLKSDFFLWNGKKIIKCKDCKHYQFADNRAFGMPVKMCKWFGFEDVDDNDFCSRAERN